MAVNNIDYPPFYVGEEVVAIRDHSQGCYTKGQTYVVRAIRKGCCVWEIDIGASHINSIFGFPIAACSICRNIEYNPVTWWMFASSFVSKAQEQFQQVEFNKILENEPCSVN